MHSTLLDYVCIYVTNLWPKLKTQCYYLCTSSILLAHFQNWKCIVTLCKLALFMFCVPRDSHVTCSTPSSGSSDSPLLLAREKRTVDQIKARISIPAGLITWWTHCWIFFASLALDSLLFINKSLTFVFISDYQRLVQFLRLW